MSILRGFGLSVALVLGTTNLAPAFAAATTCGSRRPSFRSL